VLAAAERLRRRDEFAATIKTGRRAARGSLVVHLSTSLPPNDQDLNHADPAQTRGANPPARAGFVVSKAVGNAVIRNQVKRRLRHLVREHLPTLPPGADLVVRALPAASNRGYPGLAADLAQAIEAASRPRSSRTTPSADRSRK
jgi:ribonuclease P protein component